MYSYQQAYDAIIRMEYCLGLETIEIGELFEFVHELVDAIGQHELNNKLALVAAADLSASRIAAFLRLTAERDVLSDNLKSVEYLVDQFDERIKFLLKADVEMADLYKLIQAERDELVDDLVDAQLTINVLEQEKLERTEPSEPEVELLIRAIDDVVSMFE